MSECRWYHHLLYIVAALVILHFLGVIDLEPAVNKLRSLADGADTAADASATVANKTSDVVGAAASV